MRLSTAWYITKRTLHALVWLLAMAIPVTLLLYLAYALISDPSLWSDAPFETASANALMWTVVAFIALILAAKALLLSALCVLAIRRSFSIVWPLGMLLLAACLFLGLYVFGIVGIIGFSMLIIRLAGHRDALAPSGLTDPVPAARPRGLVESIGDE